MTPPADTQVVPWTNFSGSGCHRDDVIINAGLASIILLVIYVFRVDSVFRRMRGASMVRSPSVRLALVTAALDLEAPRILNLVGMPRVSIVRGGAQWLVARAVGPLASRRRGAPHQGLPGAGQPGAIRSGGSRVDASAPMGTVGRDLSRPSEPRL